MSEDIKEIAAALSKFQGVMPILRKTGTNFTKGKAATIGDIVSVAKQGSKFGLSYYQRVDFIGDEADYVESIMMHTSGQTLSSGKYKVLAIKPNDPSSFGGAITFAKKNSLMALFGIADHDGEDHDWNLDEQGNLKPEHQADPAPAPKPVTPPKTKKPESGLTLEQRVLAVRNAAELTALWEIFQPSEEKEKQLFRQRADEIRNEAKGD